jgi:hypothetical protein
MRRKPGVVRLTGLARPGLGGNGIIGLGEAPHCGPRTCVRFSPVNSAFRGSDAERLSPRGTRLPMSPCSRRGRLLFLVSSSGEEA